MRRIPFVVAGLLVIGAFAATAAYAALSASSLATSNASNTAAGQPQPMQVLLCGTWMNGMDSVSGQSNVDHPSGASAMGKEYPYTGQNCQNNSASSIGTFSWSIRHSNVNFSSTGPNSERGTEHGTATLSSSPDFAAGFNGKITDYDFPPADGDSAPCSDGRQVQYASGHRYDPNCPGPSGPGNYNTHGGANVGQHYRGQYGTLVYQDSNNENDCMSGSNCFQAIIEGQQN